MSRSSVILTVVAVAFALFGVGVGVGAASAAPAAKATPIISTTAQQGTYDNGPHSWISVTVAADGETPTGTVEVYEPDGRLGGSGVLVDGSVAVETGFTSAETGSYLFTVRYLGDDTTYSEVATAVLIVPQPTVSVSATASPTQTAVLGGTTTITVSASAGGRFARDTGHPGGPVTISGEGIAPVTLDLIQGEDPGGSVEVGPFPHTGTYDLTVEYPRTEDLNPGLTHVSVTVVDGAASTLTASVSAQQVGQQTGTVRVAVESGGAEAPTGAVSVAYRGHQVGTGELFDGTATIDVKAFKAAGTYPLTVTYGGDDVTAPAASQTVDLVVTKAEPRVVVYAPHIVKRGAQPSVTVKVVSSGSVVDGLVRLTYRGRSSTEQLRGGSTVFRLASLNGPGSFVLHARYLSGTLYSPASLTRAITVVRH